MSKNKMVVLISGTSSGVGMHTAVEFAQAGFQVIATMRDTAKKSALESLASKNGTSVNIEELDVQDFASIPERISQLSEKYGAIDVLVNNAGAGFIGSIEQTSDEDLHRTMDVNFFGVWHLTKAVLPQMRKRGAGRIIAVTSIGGLIAQPFNEAYCAAKFAVEGMMEGLAPLAKKMGIAVSLIEPGAINTEFIANVKSVSASVANRIESPYKELLNKYISSTAGVFEKYGQTGQDVAKIILEAATSEKPHLRYVTSDFARQIVAPKLADFHGDSVVNAFASRLG